MAKAIDQYWRSIIEYSLVPTTEQLYVVGSFARSVTVYAQQVRAVGLVDSLAGLGRLRKSTRVAVVGGGIAGMTAAAALGKIGMHPQIFEKENTLAQLQRNSGRRYLHPHIYDWPLTSIHDTDAGLPVLNWRAAMASAVVKDLEEQWKDITKGSATIWPEVKKLERTGRHWRVFTGEGSYEFDVVLVCIGFGVESGSYSYPYWADLPLNDPKIHSETWLISGAGDGALTDLMRLCIRNFLHDEALRLVVETVEKTSGAAAIEKLRDRVRERVTGPSLFRTITMTASSFETARIAAAAARKDTKAIRNKWKTAATSAKRDEEFNLAAQALNAAIQELIPFASEESVYHIDAAREIGDCHGVRGGTYRDWGKYGEAAKAYGQGLPFERRSFELGGQPNSYCLVQRLVARVLANPRAFERGQLILGLNVKVELAASAKEIQQQKEVLRKGDPWAQADFALVLQLLELDSAEAEWDKFDDMLPDRGVHDATLEVVQLLTRRMSLDGTRRARWNDLEERLASE